MNNENADLQNKIKLANMEVIMQQSQLEQEAMDKKVFRSKSVKK